ncbi:hypothetical protein [Treponema sp. C6A8]|uniref:hypothetical protein n=1 Tax=Treponema sp. C6A8 TaxID=1410609 RepID=UPI0004875C97|nr:hypothetical protein [Treponema sp. C6A8]
MDINLSQQVLTAVYDFFVSSHDFNGIPLRNISKQFEIDYIESIEIIKDLVKNNLISIQSSTNPHIIGHQHFTIESQLKVLDMAKDIQEEEFLSMETLKFVSENTEYPICLYPSQEYLRENRDVSDLYIKPYTKMLALGEPQLCFHFFEIDVLDRYYNDPRYIFSFQDYSGLISCEKDEDGNPILEKKDQIFLETFGLGFDENNNRVAVTFTRYLNDLPSCHQLYWRTKEITDNCSCKVLEEYYKNAIQGEFTNSISIFSGFINELNCIYDLTKHIFGKSLLNQKFDADDKRPKEMSFFFIPTSKNYDDFVLLLDKMLSDNINKRFFYGFVSEYELVPVENNLVERRMKGTIKMLEEWFAQNFKAKDEQLLKDIFKYLKEIRRERQNPAHRISKNVYDKQYIDKQKEMIDKAYTITRSLRTAFQQHPFAKNFEIPLYLDDANIKIF